MFKTERSNELGCTVYFKPDERVSGIKICKIEHYKVVQKKFKIKNLYSLDKKKIMYLFTRGAKNEEDCAIMTKFINDNHDLSDKEIYDRLRKLLNSRVNLENNQRGIRRISIIEKHISSWSTIKPTSYLDIGCFLGDITKAVGEHFNLTKSQIFGIDIRDYMNDTNSNDFNFSEYDGINIPHEDEKFDLITCFMILHHIPPDNLDKLLEEIYRVICPGGILLIREHDASKNDHDLLDVLHEFYDYAFFPDSKWEESHAHYNSAKYWSEKIISVGFDILESGIVKKSKYKNPFNNYFAGFRRLNI